MSRKAEEIDVFDAYRRDIHNAARPTEERERELFELVQKGDDDARRELVIGHLRLVIYIAKQYRDMGVDFNDLIQEGNIGLLQSISRFDPSKGTRLASYATWWIREACMNAVSQSRMIQLPRSVIKAIRRIDEFVVKFDEKHNREPSKEEIKDGTGLTMPTIKKALFAVDEVSADETIGGEDDARTLIDTLCAGEPPLPEYEQQSLRLMQVWVRAALESLPENEQRVLKLRYGFEGPDYTFPEVARIMGYTPDHVRRLENKALDRLRTEARFRKLRAFSRTA